MKHLIVGDIHGFNSQLRGFLHEQEVIDAAGNPINRDEVKVYSVGDLIDGEVNRAGDIANLERAPEWFDKVAIGNHEYAFIGGKEFTSRRKYDRTTAKMLLELIDEEIYVPSILISESVLVTHGGLADVFRFDTARDAHEYIKVMWSLKPDLDDDAVIFDNHTSYSYSKDTAPGIFYLDWTERRNSNFMQVVGHSTFYTGPVYREYDNDIVHWNVDVGTKSGVCVGGITLDDEKGEIEVHFYGKRHENGFSKQKKTYPPKGDVMTFDPKAGQEDQQKSPPILAPTLPNGGVTSMGPEASSKKDKKKDKKKGGTTSIVSIKNEGLSDIDIALIEDPYILDVYRNEVRNGNADVRLKELIEG